MGTVVAVSGGAFALLAAALFACDAKADCWPGAVLKARLQGLEIYEYTSGNMKPTIEPGDCLIGQPFDPAMGDTGLLTKIISFRSPSQPNGPPFLARVAAIGGDRISLSGGQVILNGTPIPRDLKPPYLQTYVPEGPHQHIPRCPQPTPTGQVCEINRMAEEWPGDVRFDVIELGTGRAETTAEFTVPQGHVFVLGDNRGNSLDSRFPTASGGPGFIPMENIIAVVEPEKE